MAVHNLAVAAKRYDGNSGSAVFAGTIPLKPGQLIEADLAKVKLLDGGAEIGCSVGDLWPRHADGSLKVIRVAATLTLAPGVQKFVRHGLVVDTLLREIGRAHV